ncbi:UBX domain-containing protein 10 [Anguilla anguilla]|uniref:UBX domain-containing protein 10 n=1 Tax=Anguilla anguilla TaxID=7936 RepID=UPI0015A8DC36|nr:UBX domain-containing protein 10 [Anguilla anguilla]
MHVTRPKSSKGRSRPALNHTKSADISAYRECPVTPRPPSERAARSARPARAHAFLRQSSAVTAQEATALLQEALAPPTLSLNRYRVLPSIERKGSGDPESFRGLEEKTSKLSLSDDLMVSSRRGHRGQQLSKFHASRSNPEMGGALGRGAPRPPDPRPEAECEAAEAEGLGTAPSADQLGLLLAVRSPCGRRLQRRFLPTDTLRAVLAAAEDAHGARYGRAVVQTVEVPRRSFADLNVTLAQCGIQNRSVLCISKEDDGSADST